MMCNIYWEHFSNGMLKCLKSELNQDSNLKYNHVGMGISPAFLLRFVHTSSWCIDHSVRSEAIKICNALYHSQAEALCCHILIHV